MSEHEAQQIGYCQMTLLRVVLPVSAAVVANEEGERRDQVVRQQQAGGQEEKFPGTATQTNRRPGANVIKQILL